MEWESKKNRKKRRKKNKLPNRRGEIEQKERRGGRKILEGKRKRERERG